LIFKTERFQICKKLQIWNPSQNIPIFIRIELLPLRREIPDNNNLSIEYSPDRIELTDDIRYCHKHSQGDLPIYYQFGSQKTDQDILNLINEIGADRLCLLKR